MFEIVRWCGVRLKFSCEDHSLFCVGNVLLLELMVLPRPAMVLPLVGAQYYRPHAAVIFYCRLVERYYRLGAVLPPERYYRVGSRAWG